MKLSTTSFFVLVCSTSSLLYAEQTQELVAQSDVPDAKPDGSAAADTAVSVEGDSPGYQDIRVSDRSPNMFGQTGLFRVTSAKAGESGYFDLGLHGRYFYADGFIVPASVDQATYGVITFGATITDYLELSLSGLAATNENSATIPRTTFSIGDVGGNVKASIPFSMFAFGVDAHLGLPSTRDRIGFEFDNFNAQLLGLFSIDFYEDRGWPVRLHFNAGYSYQNRGDDKARLLDGANGHLLALTFEYNYYDRILYGVGFEAPFPYATPFIELSGEYALAPNMAFADAPMRVTPGLRITPGRGLAIDLGADIRVLGGNQLIAGVATPSPWQVHVGLSYNFSPFVAETRVEVRETEKILRIEKKQGRVAGLVVDAHSKKPIANAVLSFVEADGPRILADAEGRYRSYALMPGSIHVTAEHADYHSGSGEAVVNADESSRLDIELVPDPKVGKLKGVIVDEKDKSVPAQLELIDDQGVVRKNSLPGGSYDLQLPPGTYQAVVKADGYLQQGRNVVVVKKGQTIEDFVLKPEPKRRVTVLKRDRIEIKSTIHFEFGKARILANSYHILDEVVDIMLKNTQVAQVRIEGHTDNVGDPAYNEKLSQSRAQAVYDYLAEHGVKGSRLEAIGYGESKPLATNKTQAGRAKNRRVEFNIVEQEEPDSSTQKSE